MLLTHQCLPPIFSAPSAAVLRNPRDEGFSLNSDESAPPGNFPPQTGRNMVKHFVLPYDPIFYPRTLRPPSVSGRTLAHGLPGPSPLASAFRTERASINWTRRPQ